MMKKEKSQMTSNQKNKKEDMNWIVTKNEEHEIIFEYKNPETPK